MKSALPKIYCMRLDETICMEKPNELAKRVEMLEKEVTELRRMLYEHLRFHGITPPFHPSPDPGIGPTHISRDKNDDRDVGKPWSV